MRPTDMGTTGLIKYVFSARFGKHRALARATAERVLRGRQGDPKRREEVIRRFRAACAIAEKAEMEKEQASYRAAVQRYDALEKSRGGT